MTRMTLQKSRRRIPHSFDGESPRLLLRQPGLAQAFEQRRYDVPHTLSVPFDGETGIKAKGFRHGGPRLIHLAFERIGGGQICVNVEHSITGVDCLTVFVGSGVKMPEPKFCMAQPRMPYSC